MYSSSEYKFSYKSRPGERKKRRIIKIYFVVRNVSWTIACGPEEDKKREACILQHDHMTMAQLHVDLRALSTVLRKRRYEHVGANEKVVAIPPVTK